MSSTSGYPSSSPPLLVTIHLHRSSPPPLRREKISVHLTNSLRATGSELRDNFRTHLSIEITNHRVQLFDSSGETRPNADFTQREDLSPISPTTVQNRCYMFLRMKNSLTVELPPTKWSETSTSPWPDLPLLSVPHAFHTKLLLSLSNGKRQKSNLPIAGQSPVIDVSPTEAANHSRELGQRRKTASGVGQKLMGLNLSFRNPILFTSPSVLSLLTLDRIFKIRFLRLFHIDFVHGSRVVILMPDNYLLASKTVRYDRSSIPPFRCFNVGIKSDYSVFIRALVLRYRVISIHGWFHDVEQASPLNDSIFRFIAMLVVIILPLSLTPGVIASSTSI